MKPSLRRQKSIQRKRLRRILETISAADRRVKSSEITKKILNLSAFKKARRIMVYLALPNEVQTMPFVNAALRRGKEVYAPIVEKRKKQIDTARIRQPSRDLKEGAYGIMEPKRQQGGGRGGLDFDIIIIPGIGFDRQGGRLGRGGGYFDRFLKKTGSALKIGVAFSNQIIKKVPSGSGDVRMDLVITD